MKKTFKRLIAFTLALSLFATSGIYALGESDIDTTIAEPESQTEYQPDYSMDKVDVEPESQTEALDSSADTVVSSDADVLPEEDALPEEVAPTEVTNTSNATKETQSEKYAVVFEKPAVDGGDATILAFGIDEEYNNDIDYEPVVYGYENTYEEGTVLYYKISTLENFEIKEVTDQDGNTISPSAVKDFVSVYTFEVTDDMTITTVYDVVNAPEGSFKVTYQVAGDVYPDEFKVPASQILSEGENSATDLAQVENVTDENNVTWTFDGWYLDETLTEKIDTLTLTEDITVYGAWKSATAPVFTVTTSIDNGGTINVIDTRTGGEVKARTSEAVTVNFEPATGYEVSEIIVNDEALTGDDLAKAIEEGSYTITKLDAPYTINVATKSSNGPYTLTVKLYGMTVEQAKAFDSSVVINDYKKDEFLLASINMGEFNRDASKKLSDLINSNNINFKKITDASNGDIIFQSAGVGGNSKISVENLAYSRFVHDNYIYQYRSNTETSTSFKNQLEQPLSGDITLELFYSEVVTFKYKLYNEAEASYYPSSVQGAFSLDKDFSYLYTRDTNIFNSSFKYIIGEAPSFEGVTFSKWFYGVEGNADQAVDIVANGVEAIAKEHGYTKLNDESDDNGLNRSYIDLYAIYTSDKNISFAYQIGDGEVKNFSEENNVSFAFSSDLEKLKERITNKIDYLKTKVLDDKYDVKSTYVLSSNEDYTKWENLPGKNETIVIKFEQTGTIQIQYVDEDGEVLTTLTTANGLPGVSYQALINDFTPDATFTSESDVKYYLISDSGKYASGTGSYVAGETHVYTYTYNKFSNVNFDFAIAEVDNTDRPIIDSNLLSSINEIKKDLTEENKKAIEAKVNEINKALVDMGYQFTGIASNSIVSYDENGISVNDALASDVTVVLEFKRIPYTVNINILTEDTYGVYSSSEPETSIIYKNELLTEGFTKTYSNRVDEFDTTVYYYAGYNNQKGSSVINSEEVEYTVNKDTFKDNATSIDLTFIYNKYRVVKTQVTVDGVLQPDEIINGLVDLKLKSSGLDNNKDTAIEEYIKSYLATKAAVWHEYDIKDNFSGIKEDGTIPNDLTVELTVRSPKQVIIRYATTGNATLAEVVLTTNTAGEKLYFGDSYDFSSYVLAGGENLRGFGGYNYSNHTGNYTSPEGGITENVILEVIYSTAGGGGGGGGEDVVPTTPTIDPTPTVPSPTDPTPTDPTPTPTDPTPTAPVTDPTTPDPTPVVDEPAAVTPDADYDLTPVEDTETPLANVNLDGEGFCILHLLLMLAALATLISYTNSMKKRQKRIFELEEKAKLRLLIDEDEMNNEIV